MNRTLPLVFLALGAVAAFGVAALLRSEDSSGRSDSAEIAALRGQLDELRREVADLRERSASPAVASPASPRESAPAGVATISTPEAAGAPAPVSVASRDAILAVIREDREAREREREEQQRKQQRERTAQRVRASAERAGLDASTTDALVSLYLDALDREDDVRRAYPISDFTDPEIEKRRLELQAVWSERDARVAGLLPAEKREQWERSTRWLDRGRELMEGLGGGGDRPFRARGDRERRNNGDGSGAATQQGTR